MCSIPRYDCQVTVRSVNYQDSAHWSIGEYIDKNKMPSGSRAMLFLGKLLGPDPSFGCAYRMARSGRQIPVMESNVYIGLNSSSILGLLNDQASLCITLRIN